MPDDTWLMRLTMNAGELQLFGESGNAAALIPLLESSEYFDNARFRSPDHPQQRPDKDRFHVSARFVREEEET